MCCKDSEDALKVVEVFRAFAGFSGRRPNNVDLTWKGTVLFCLKLDAVKLLISCLI